MKMKVNFSGLMEDLWDKHSAYIDDNSDSFSFIAGSTVMRQRDFKKVAEYLEKLLDKLLGDESGSETEGNAKAKMVEAAIAYSSISNGGITVNNPDRYKIFREGQDSGFRIANDFILSEGKEAVEFASEIAKMVFEQKYWPYVSPPEHQCEKEKFVNDLNSKLKIWKAEAK